MQTIEIDNLWNNFTYNNDTKSYYYDGAKQLANLIFDTSNKDYIKYERTFSCGYLCLLINSKASKMPSLVIFKPKTKCTSSNAVNFWDNKLTHKKHAKSIFNENTVFTSSQMLFGSIVKFTDIKTYITSNSDIQNADTIANTIFNSDYHGLEYTHKIKHIGHKKYIFSKKFSSIDAAKAASTSYKDYDGIFSMFTSSTSSSPVIYIEQPRNYINNINFVTYQKHSIDIHEHIKYKPLKCISTIQNENSACKIITSCTCAYYNDNANNSGGIVLYFTQRNQRSKDITNVLGNQFCLLFGYNNNDKFDLGFKSAYADQHNRTIASTFTNDNVIFAHINNQIATLVSSNANTRLIDDLPITEKSQYYTHDIHLFTSTFNSNCSYISSNINTYKVKIDSKIFKPLYILANDADMNNWTSYRRSQLCQNIIWSTSNYDLSMRNHEKYEFISGNIAVEK